MGALFSSLLETILGEPSDWLETGLRRGYFALHKHWTAADVQRAQLLLTQQARQLRLTSLSLVGSSFDDAAVLQDLIQVVVARPELETLRLAVNDDDDDVVIRQVPMATIVAKHPHGQQSKPLLRVEYFTDAQQVAAYWRDLSLLPSSNVLVLMATDEEDGNNNNNNKSSAV